MRDALFVVFATVSSMALGCAEGSPLSPRPPASPGYDAGAFEDEPDDAGLAIVEPDDAGLAIAPEDAAREVDAGGPIDEVDPCFDGLDGDADGRIDEGCACEIGATQECYDGPAILAGVGACVRGVQTCAASAPQLVEWGSCEGSVAPIDEICNGVDDDCDGAIDEETSPMVACGTNVGVCRAGTRICRDGRLVCDGAIVPGREICHNDLDDDCDGQTDEGCVCLDAEGTAPWEQFIDSRLRCFGSDLDRDPREFTFASIPSAMSTVWTARRIETIDFRDPSTIPSTFCAGRHTGGVFTYFQTFLDLPAGPVPAVRVRFSDVDDAVHAVVYNAAHASGCTASAWYAYDAGATWDLTRCFTAGLNRLVLVHVDDNPSTRALTGVEVTVGTVRARTCP